MLWWSIAITVAILLLGLAAPYFPVTGDRHEPWDLAQRALGFEALKSLPAWWSSVLPVLGALPAVDAARAAASRLARAGWVLTALLLAWLSVDHQVAIHEALGRLELRPLGPLAGHPVEVGLAVVGGLAAVALVMASHWRVVVLLVAAGGAYASSEAVDLFGPPVSLSGHHAAMLEVGLSWVGLLLVLMAALWATAAPAASDGPEPDGRRAVDDEPTGTIHTYTG